MNKFKIIPIEEKVAEAIRHGETDEFGNTLPTVITNGTGPCRFCLQPFTPGKDERILFSYQPNKAHNPYTERGPVYIHAHACKPYDNVHEFPSAMKNDRKNFPLTIRCYDDEDRMTRAVLVGDKDVDEVINKLFENPAIKTLHARNAEYGCFIAKIERV